MSFHTDTVEKPEPQEYFERMAELIKHNEGKDFGGAFVIVPPLGEPAMVQLVLDPKQDVAHFFMLLSTKIQQALDEIKQRESRSHFGGR